MVWTSAKSREWEEEVVNMKGLIRGRKPKSGVSRLLKGGCLSEICVCGTFVYLCALYMHIIYDTKSPGYFKIGCVPYCIAPNTFYKSMSMLQPSHVPVISNLYVGIIVYIHIFVNIGEFSGMTGCS